MTRNNINKTILLRKVSRAMHAKLTPSYLTGAQPLATVSWMTVYVAWEYGTVIEATIQDARIPCWRAASSLLLCF